jgi:hypothetical protein
VRLGGRRPGASVAFVDTANEEVLLEIAAGENGLPLIAFHLYDASGALVADSHGRQTFPEGLQVRGGTEEVLLLLPTSPEESIHYRIYSSAGRLLACSDGARTQIFGGLRMDGPKPVSHSARAVSAPKEA